MTAKTHKIAVLPGDGIGPEVVEATLIVLNAVQKVIDVKLEMLKGEAGFDVISKYGTNLPTRTVEMIKKTDACLKGPMTTPEEPGSPRSVAVTLRSMFDLYANMRPARTLPNVPSLKPNIDMIVVRENTEDLYVGKEFEVAPGIGIAIKINTTRASERIAKFAFDLAMKRRKKLAFVHKANILKLTDRIFKLTPQPCNSYGDRRVSMSWWQRISTVTFSPMRLRPWSAGWVSLQAEISEIITACSSQLAGPHRSTRDRTR